VWQRPAGSTKLHSLIIASLIALVIAKKMTWKGQAFASFAGDGGPDLVKKRLS